MIKIHQKMKGQLRFKNLLSRNLPPIVIWGMPATPPTRSGREKESPQVRYLPPHQLRV
jgi:hypothetical protein